MTVSTATTDCPTEDGKRRAALQRFEQHLNRSIAIRHVEPASQHDYESAYEPDQHELIVRVTTAPIRSMQVIDCAAVLHNHIEERAFDVDGLLIDHSIPPRDRWHTKGVVFYFAVCY